MNVYVFAGPTLSEHDARLELDATYLPPASQGDVVRAARTRPRAIGIIDGYFERLPAVWHKEILWAMSEGVHVFGSASMGALRAAELAAFGMEGVGCIFEAYRDGVLEDDDEVAVAHAGADAGYRAVSEAMVNIRLTLQRAVAEDVLSPLTGHAVEKIAKELFYPDRSYPTILERAWASGLQPGELEAFRDWLPIGCVNQKRSDAIAMLRVMRERLTGDLAPKRVAFTFEHTEWWDRALSDAGDLAVPELGAAGSILPPTLLDELRLEVGGYARAWEGTLARFLAVEEARRQGMVVDATTAGETSERFRRARGLHEPEEMARWAAEQHLTAEGFRRLMEEEALLAWVEHALTPALASRLPDYLRVAGYYSRLSRRMEEKRRFLDSTGLRDAGLADAGLTEDQLLQWYFEEHVGRPVPDSVAEYALAAGFDGGEPMKRAVLAEYWFTQRATAPAGNGR